MSVHMHKIARECARQLGATIRGIDWSFSDFYAADCTTQTVDELSRVISVQLQMAGFYNLQSPLSVYALRDRKNANLT